MNYIPSSSAHLPHLPHLKISKHSAKIIIFHYSPLKALYPGCLERGGIRSHPCGPERQAGVSTFLKPGSWLLENCLRSGLRIRKSAPWPWKSKPNICPVSQGGAEATQPWPPHPYQPCSLSYPQPHRGEISLHQKEGREK